MLKVSLFTLLLFHALFMENGSTIAEKDAELNQQININVQRLADLEAQVAIHKAYVDANDVKIGDLQSESELLLLQLHQVQEELESVFLKEQETQAEVDDADASLAALMERATALRAELTSGAPPATDEDKDALASLLMAVEQTWLPVAADCGPGGIPERLAAAVEQARRSLSRTRSPTERAGSSQPRGTAEAAAMAVPGGGLDDDIEISDAEDEEPAAASAASAEAASAEKRKAALEEAMMALAVVAEGTSEVPRETAERAVAAADVVRALMQAQTKRRKTGNVPAPQQRAQQQHSQAVQQALALQQAQAMHQHHQQQQHELAQQQMLTHQHLQLQHLQQQHQAPS
jgi:hypothetical protein